MHDSKLVPGVRYEWNVSGILRNALFTGEFDNNGSALLTDRSGATWGIPAEELRPAKKAGQKGRVKQNA